MIQIHKNNFDCDMLYSHYINLNRQIFMLNFFSILDFFGIFSQQNKWGGGRIYCRSIRIRQNLVPQGLHNQCCPQPETIFVYKSIQIMYVIYREHEAQILCMKRDHCKKYIQTIIITKKHFLIWCLRTW